MINVMPVNDLYEHIESTLCPCKPTIELRKDHKEIIIHNSFQDQLIQASANDILKELD